MKQVNAYFIVGLVFALIGAIFAVIGVAFLLTNFDLLPQLADSEVWMGDTPDALALPIIGVVFTALGALFVIMGLVFLWVVRRQRLLREELLRFGTRVTGTVSDIRIDRSVRVNGVSPLRLFVTAQHPYTGETMQLRGPSVWNTPLTTGDPIDVLFDPQDEKKYVVELPGEKENI